MRKAGLVPAFESLPVNKAGDGKEEAPLAADRAARLLKLKAQVHEGIYRIPADAIAAKLIKRIKAGRPT